jgi:hypothetical protein
MIFRECQMVARCDKCGTYDTEVESRPSFIKRLRREGWRIGKKAVLCPKCAKNKERKGDQ